MRALILKTLFYFFSALPLRLTHNIGAMIGQLYYVLPNKLRNISLRNIQTCFPDKNHHEQTLLLQKSLIETAKTFTEMGAIWIWPKKKVLALVQSIEGEDLLQQAVSANKPIIMCLPHLGCWEIIGLYLADKYGMTSLYRPPRLSALSSFIKKARQRTGAVLVPANKQGIRDIYRQLAHKGLVAILPDQEPQQGSGHFINFFNVPAYTMTLLPRLAIKSQAQILFAYAERLPQGRGYTIHIHRADNNPVDSNIKDMGHIINAELEQCILEKPEQYQWSYKRFRTRPENQPPLY